MIFCTWLLCVGYHTYTSKWNIFCRYMIASTHKSFVLVKSTEDFQKDCDDILRKQSNEPINIPQNWIAAAVNKAKKTVGSNFNSDLTSFDPIIFNVGISTLCMVILAPTIFRQQICTQTIPKYIIMTTNIVTLLGSCTLLISA
eukprot:375378_1